MARSLAMFWLVTLTRLMGPIRAPHLAVVTFSQRIIHRGQMDTPDTAGQHHDSHHIYSKQFVSFFCICVNPLFSSMSKRAGESFATSASAKQVCSLHSNDSEKHEQNTSGCSMILHQNHAAARGGARTLPSNIGQYLFKTRVNILPITKNSRSTLRSGANSRAFAHGLHLG